MSKYHYLILDGHGDLDADGNYVTAGKRSPKLPDGRVVYEGVINRDIAEKLAAMMASEDIDFTFVTPGYRDISLEERARISNSIASKYDNCILISIHCNAAGDGYEFNDACGVGSYYYKNGESYSKNGLKLAEMLQDELIMATGMKDRGTRGRNFYILRETSMPAVLSENGFFTNLNEAEKLLDNSFRLKIARGHFNFIKRLEKEGL